MIVATLHLWVYLQGFHLTYAHRQGPCTHHPCNNQLRRLDSCDESLLSFVPDRGQDKLVTCLPKLAANIGNWFTLDQALPPSRTLWHLDWKIETSAWLPPGYHPPRSRQRPCQSLLRRALAGSCWLSPPVLRMWTDGCEMALRSPHSVDLAVLHR